MIKQIFLWPEVKQSVIVSKKLVYEFPDEFPNDLSIRILGN